MSEVRTMVNDPIADMLTRIRNALMRRKESVEMPSSKMLVAIAGILKEEGFIQDYEVLEGGSYPILRIRLKYKREGTRKWIPAITGLRRVSKPSRRIYVGADEIKPVRSGLGIAILSTSQGVMTDKEARKRHIGGELICEVW